jgi:hypothetical protein
MRYAFHIALFIGTLTTLASEDKLPPSAERPLLHQLRAVSVIEVHDLRQRRIGQFDYLGFAGEFSITWGFEGIYHPLVVLRRKHTDADWSKAKAFLVHAPEIPTLFASSESDFRRALGPWQSQ